jgi:hypothetical protein
MIKALPILLLAALQSANAGAAETKLDSSTGANGIQRFGNFGAQLVLTDNEAEFMKSWNSSNGHPTLKTADTVRRGSPIVAMILFTGCKADVQKKCNVIVKYKTHGPKGVSSESPEFPVWTAAAPKDNLLYLGTTHTSIAVEKNEPIGKYRLEAIVTDKVSGTTLNLETRFNATK